MVQKTMRTARMHVRGEPLTIDQLEVPTPRPTDVLVEVKACGIVPNLGNVLNKFVDWFPHLSLPPLPAIFGLDPAGVVVDKGSQVHGIEIGQRVYVNPGRYCGGCRYCRIGETTSCKYFAFNGYFGFSPEAKVMFEDYPYGGLAEYMTAPQYSLVALPDNVSFETAARWGYMGTGFRALKQADVAPSDVVLITASAAPWAWAPPCSRWLSVPARCSAPVATGPCWSGCGRSPPAGSRCTPRTATSAWPTGPE